MSGLVLEVPLLSQTYFCVDECDGDNSDTKCFGVLFDGRDGIYLYTHYAAFEALGLINTGLH